LHKCVNKKEIQALEKRNNETQTLVKELPAKVSDVPKYIKKNEIQGLAKHSSELPTQV